MKLSINNNDLSDLKHGKCEDCAFHYDHPGFCIFLHIMCFKDSKIFYRTSYNSTIFKL